MSARILITDDDPHIRDVIRIATEAAGMQTIEAANGELALSHIGREAVDLVVLDVGMPQMDGFDCCKAIRAKSNVPILFLTAQDDEVDRVLGFQLGGDDYVSKPFSPRELVLRIKAILARGRPATEAVRTHGALELDAPGHSCRIGGLEMALTATEFALLERLLQHPDQVLDRNQLIDGIYGHNTTLSGRTVDSHIRNIRAKAAALNCHNIIVTVHGVGVKLGPCGG
ncbi:response regulator transcription factor [Litoreibacter roseus]|uniref:DNA-binding response regulator n=1 Tax=Litoreibacter roseus TaxID=2601869 RepID=A0A6N6JE96_9RHOB|nr:response regulator transcription factor [Litoreibacter roseus]GFE64671.1 DNA-binding response regulator [Litoreibacter roseus]